MMTKVPKLYWVVAGVDEVCAYIRLVNEPYPNTNASRLYIVVSRSMTAARGTEGSGSLRADT